MSIHKNARLIPLRREEMALAVTVGQLSRAQAARVYCVSPELPIAANVSIRTA